MKKITTLAASIIALTLGAPAWAQDGASNDIAPPQEAPIDQARLAAAKITVDHLFPLGTYERMMKGTMDQIMDSVLSGVSGMTVGDLAGASGLPNDEMSDEEKAKTIGDIAKEADPHFEERMKISNKVMMGEMVGLMTTMEPAIRTALSKIYARKYTAPQLGEMNAFFATQTGSAFARDYMMVFVDPEMMQSMMSMVPEMMTAMPDIMKKVEEATKHLPKVTGAAVEEEIEDIADADEDDDAAAWNDRDNWSEEDRALVEKLDVESDDAISRYFDAKEAAQENAKKRLKKGD